MNIVFDPRFLTKSYTPAKISSEGEFRLKIIEKYQLLRQKGLSEKEAFELLEIKRSTFYRWFKLFKENKWNKKSFGLENKSKRPHNFRKTKVITQDLVSQILKIRQAFPMYGKEKIKILLQRNKVVVSESTVGRVLLDLIKRRRIYPVPLLKGKNRNYKKAINKRYAKRWKFERAKELGEMIQIDHMSVNIHSEFTLKEFKAICPISRIVISKLYFKATAHNARDFLKHVEARLPFKIKSIQADGGSEFMAEFEEYCRKKELDFFVLPPRSPKYNGKVERANGTYRYEFYNSYQMPDTMEELRPMFEEFEYHYNYIRPHKSLENLTPMEYYAKISREVV